MAQQKTDLGEVSFEGAVAELEAIVEKLEKGQTPLEESIRLYSRGEALREHCDKLLRSAEERIDKIALGPDGKPKGVMPLDPKTS